MRRTALLVAVMALAMVAASGVALADRISGNENDNRLVGTNDMDNISGAAGNDDIFGKGGPDKLFGDGQADDVYGGKGSDRLQSGLGRDDLFGQEGNDFANAIDGQVNDRIDCGRGDEDVAGVDTFFDGQQGDVDQIAENCEFVYIGIGPFPTNGPAARGESGTDLSAIDTRAEAEQAEAKGLLRQIK